jgi:hypothetical protein
MGLNCGHEMKNYDEMRQPLPLPAIHLHWPLNFGEADEASNNAQHILELINWLRGRLDGAAEPLCETSRRRRLCWA